MSHIAGSTVTENLYVFTAQVVDSAAPDRMVTVVFLPHENTTAEIVRPALTDYLDAYPTGHEVWVVCHQPHRAQLDAILSDGTLAMRCDGRPLRGIVIESDGSWAPHKQESDSRLISIDQPTTQSVLDSGLRRQFTDAKSLLTAHGRFHFGKPGGAHSKNFLRAQPAVARDAHAHFMAAALLRHLDIEHVRRIWIDTAGITSVAGALGAVRAAHFVSAPQLLVDTFSGYDGFPTSSASMGASDAVIISSSTSGALAERIARETSVATRQIVTLFFVAGLKKDSDLPAAAPVGTICDLTRRGPDRDLTYIEPFVTYPNGSCRLCEDHEPAVPLEGDGFLPVTGTLTARSILATDGSEQPLSEFVELAMPHGSLRVRHGSDGRRMRTVSTTIAPLLAASAPAFTARLDKMLQELADQAKSEPAIDHVLHLNGEDSDALASHLSARLPNVQAKPARISEGIPAIERARNELPRHVLVVCAVASSGRTLLDVSRKLRFLPLSTRISYFIAVAHPESSFAWGMVRSSLSKRSANVNNGFVEGWQIYREALGATPTSRPLFSHDESRASDRRWFSSDPWDKEAALIEELLTRPHDDKDYGLFLATRAAELAAMPDQQSPKRLFLGSGVGKGVNGLPRLNSKFVFWDFDWAPEDATEELVYWTITSVLQRNRWSSATHKAGQYLHVSTGGHFFVIEPMMFDRFNDPIIQASILRASASGELDYSTDGTRSRYMRELIVDAARNSENERGAAINEFLLSLAMGTLARDGRHLRLKPAELDALVADLSSIPLLTLPQELIRLLTSRSAPRPAITPEALDEPF
ncbi:hypothetical protein [uncultured Microbacterium sp.]|uniref:hypothetical protein n=1 Tax=uncultured Microbacterium sp. TaxID=191216 RepID=UPI00259513E5|nr:hypothetical protein [uncultured Microbacterium sp.]